MENKELNLNEMEDVVGGTGGYSRRPKEKAGFALYQIQRGDNLTRIGRVYGVTADYLKSINPSITNINDITAGYWIYVPATGIL